jgi:flavin reductase (DIM6/NTAB) family NADH-FMN oxidoreductase RutF
MKKKLEPIDLIYPLPVVLVTTADKKGNNNIITIACITNLSRKPVHLGISIGKTKYSINLINETMEFCVNIPSRSMIEKIDKCGFTHGNSTDKFAFSELTKKDADFITPKLIDECPINIECKVIDVLDLGSNLFFIGKVLVVHLDEDMLLEGNEVDFTKVDPVLFTQKKYYSLGRLLGQRGFFKKE